MLQRDVDMINAAVTAAAGADEAGRNNTTRLTTADAVRLPVAYDEAGHAVASRELGTAVEFISREALACYGMSASKYLRSGSRLLV